MNTVTLRMYDEFKEVEVTRTIDGSNLMVNDASAPAGWESNIMGDDEQIRQSLNKWIAERGNQQHNTILTLKDWTVND